MSMSDIIKQMKKDGGVVNKAKLDDAVNAVSLYLKTTKGHATYGVYNEKGKLKLCFDVIPYKDEQKNVHRHAESSINEQITKESLKAYIELTKHWHPYEVFPSMGISVMAPFALRLREKGKMVVILWHYAPQSHLGKSTVQRIFSFNLFNIYPSSGDKINSVFRLLSVIDSVCAYVSINEVDNVDWKKYDDVIKQSPENYEAGARGSGDLSIQKYLSRGVLGLTSNRFKIMSKNTLNRIFKIPFDTNKESKRNLYENTKKLDELMAKLTPFGWRLVEDELQFINEDIKTLIQHISEHESEFRKHYKRFADPRRPFSWGLVYEGLKVWERTCKKFDVDWIAPTYEEFANDVIKKIEKATKESGITPLTDFFAWWEMWKVKNKRSMRVERGYDAEAILEIAGEGEIWAEKELPKWREENNKGDVITIAVLREYQRDHEHQIDSLKDIGRAVMAVIGVPLDEIYKGWKIGTQTKRGVFIPHDLPRYKEMKL
jgi:hypothetical protein